MINGAPVLGSALAVAEQVVSGVRRGDLDRVTRCAPWTVGAVIDHLAGVLRLTAAVATGRDPAEAMWANVVLSHERPVDSFVRAVDELKGALADGRPPCATCALPDGRVPLAFAIDVAALEAVVHADDIAVTIGAETDVDLALAERLVGVAETRCHLAGRSLFEPTTVVDVKAPPFDRLLAFTGRSAVSCRAVVGRDRR